MSTASQFSSTPIPPGRLLGSLFPPGVIVRERLDPGVAADLHPAEAECVSRAVPKRIAEFAAGRACARAALAEFGVRDFPLRAAPDRQPIWPDGFIGSITHTHGFCAAAVAARGTMLAIGLDTEIVGAPTADIWPVIARSEEMQWVQSLAVDAQPAAVTLLFAAKEAFYKCQYPLVAEWLDFHDMRVEAGRWGEAAGGTFTVTAVRSIRFAQRASLPLEGHYLFHDGFVSAGVAVPPEAQ